MSTPTLPADSARAGRNRIEWARRFMPVLDSVAARLRDTGVLDGRTIGLSLVLEPKTANLALRLHEGGAEVAVTCPAAETDDEVAAALATQGVQVFASADASPRDDHRHAHDLLDRAPDVLVDDGAGLIRLAHLERDDALPGLVGAAEETTSGLRPLRVMEREGSLSIPCLAVNDAHTKYLFDNVYGTGQSCVAAVLDLTNLQMAGKVCVVIGYGWVGRGVAGQARALGARVVVTEIDPIRALRAYHDGYEVERLHDVCAAADIVMSATGIAHSVTLEHMRLMHDGALLAVAGGVADEIAVAELARAGAERTIVRRDVVEYALPDGPTVLVLADGECVNVSAGEGNPVEIMDLSLALQALAVEHLLIHGPAMAPGVHPLPAALDDYVARTKLAAVGAGLDEPSDRQRRFLDTWAPSPQQPLDEVADS